MKIGLGEQLRGKTLKEARRLTCVNGKMPSDKELLWHMQRGRCFYCDRHMNLWGNNGRSCTRDHVVPQSWRTGISAMVAACRDCNMFRSNTPAEIFILVMHAIIDSQGGELREHPMQRPVGRLRSNINKYLATLSSNGALNSAA